MGGRVRHGRADAATPIGPRTVFQACSISMHVAAFGALRFNALLTNAVIFHNTLDIAEIVR